ncbi:MAG TPA: DedA family protein [Kineosporiaceae bacterium]|nr:DedA family protein [Kineosporiaceae bacterium]
MTSVVHDLLTAVPVWAVYLLVFTLPFLEASIMLGFVIPGETALVFGGILAANGESKLAVVLAIAVVGAIAGDAIGYLIGRRYGRTLQVSRLGQIVGEPRWRTAEEFIIRRGGPAVFLGRFTALLRALVPGVAGMAGLPYRTFALWNVLGGATWAGACVLGGWAVGDAITTYLSSAGYLVFALVIVATAVFLLHKRRERLQAEQTP